MRRLPNNQMEFNIGLGVKAHSLDVVADIIGTMRMQKIIEITENVQPNEKERIEQLDKELKGAGVMQSDVWRANRNSSDCA